MTIEVLNNVNNKKHKTKWFLDKYNPFLFFVENQDSYDWVPFNFPILFYKKRERYTKIIDLTKSSEEIFKGFSSTTRNEIHKIQKLSASINYDENPIKVFNVTNNMFKQKGLNNLCDYSINPQNKLLCTSIKFDSFFVCHSYLINEDKSTIVLFTSASEYRELDGKKKNLNSVFFYYIIIFRMSVIPIQAMVKIKYKRLGTRLKNLAYQFTLVFSSRIYALISFDLKTSVIKP